MSNPDARGRTEILNLYLQDKPLGEDVDVQVLARGTPGFSGAGKLSDIFVPLRFFQRSCLLYTMNHMFMHMFL